MEALSQRTSAHRRELEESREEILIGEVIAWMAEAGYPVIGIASDVDYQRIRFRTPKDPVVHSVLVAVDRIHSTKHQASLMIRGEARVYASSPDEILSTHLKLEKMMAQPLKPGEWKVSRQTNTLFAATERTVHLTELLSDKGRGELGKTLKKTLASLKDTLTPFQITTGEPSS